MSLIDRHPHAAAALAVPATIVGIASVIEYPFASALFLLVGVGLVVMDLYNRGQTEGEQRTRVAAVAEKRNHQQQHADHTRALAKHARSQAEPNGPGVVVAASPKLDLMKRLLSSARDPDTDLSRPRLELENEARAAEALAVKAEALALEARARAIRLRLKAEARAN